MSLYKLQRKYVSFDNKFFDTEDDLFDYINNLKENDEILVKTKENVYREVKLEIVSAKINIDNGYNNLKYNFISL